ncbi:TetR/AcrR family transcriptional regulator [Sphingomonas sp. UYP23]
MDAIFEAAIQVLTVIGPTGLTTTQVASRAGVSVGTLYQYFPNKQAMLYALSERLLDAMATQIELACHSKRCAPLRQMTERFVSAYWQAVTDRCDVARALYRIAAQVDTVPLLDGFFDRVRAAMSAMFASAPDARFDDLTMVSLTLLTSITGSVRALFDRNLPKPWACDIERELILMCHAYLATANLAKDACAHRLPA